ncbi:NAD(P)-binding protein [Macroventuria anomochaeta]|uniref:NAD(P)-binding protein n=1 Tax=Macroventuria anomochaeta TaxID=301207 RepID=A0ACB6SC83_9PLEO|nr:NAD(P)-binding protein [Macroventuria anomochaeta]KAF2631210.1 NAD(P)-binding protein [Macroventuria anomochaeta]
MPSWTGTSDTNATEHPRTFKEKVVTVAGASRGVGLATAKYVLARGAFVLISSSSAANIAKARAEIPEIPNCEDRVLNFICDITKLEQVEAWIWETVKRFGRIDCCANLSALEHWRDVVDVNMTGMFHLLREQLKVVSDKYASFGQGAYIASKHGLMGLIKVAAFGAASKGIRVNAINPGIRTEMLAKPFIQPDGSKFISSGEMLPQLFRRLAEPEEIISAICYFLSDDG